MSNCDNWSCDMAGMPPSAENSQFRVEFKRAARQKSQRIMVQISKHPRSVSACRGMKRAPEWYHAKSPSILAVRAAGAGEGARMSTMVIGFKLHETRSEDPSKPPTSPPPSNDGAADCGCATISLLVVDDPWARLAELWIGGALTKCTYSSIPFRTSFTGYRLVERLTCHPGFFQNTCPKDQ